MAESTSVAVRRDGTIKIKDGSTNVYTVAYENGDFTYTEEKSDRVVIRDRGTIVGLRRADDPVLSFSSRFISEKSQIPLMIPSSISS